MVKKVIKQVKTKAKKVVKSPNKKGVFSPITKNNLHSTLYEVVIIGGGPAGLMAACHARVSVVKL